MPSSPSVSAADLLVLAAHAHELAPLKRELATRPPSGIRCMTGVVGVGMPAAGGGAAQAILRARPRGVVLVGSAGVYPGRFPFRAATVVVADAIDLVDSAVAAGRGAHPEPMETRAEPDALLTAALGGDLRRVRVATTPSVTTDDALARELAERSGCDVENLEALSVALACRATQVPFAVVLAITNEVGARGRAQWAAHHDAAAAATHAFVARWLRAGAKGLPRG